MENYTPPHNDYEALRQASEQQSIRQNEQQAQEQAQQLQEQTVQEQKEQELKAQGEKAQELKEQEQKAQDQKIEEQKEQQAQEQQLQEQTAQEQKEQEQKVQEQEEQKLKEQEPVRTDQHYGEQRYAQGSGDYVSETTAALKNTHMINSDYYASLQANEAGDRDMARDAVETEVAKEQTAEAQQETTPRDEEVSKLAEDYAAGNPDSGATEEEIYEAAYFAKSVEDSEKYPPLNEDMKNQVEDRQASEEIGDSLREVSDAEMERSYEEQQELMQERMQGHLSQQHSVSASMA